MTPVHERRDPVQNGDSTCAALDFARGGGRNTAAKWRGFELHAISSRVGPSVRWTMRSTTSIASGAELAPSVGAAAGQESPQNAFSVATAPSPLMLTMPSAASQFASFVDSV
jgi:hypothetical protein